MLHSFQEYILLLYVTARSVPKGEQDDALVNFYAFADEFYFALVEARTETFKLMWLPSTFPFFYLSPLPSGFLIFPGPSSLWLPSIPETDAP